jgi:hypothetical protein
MGGALSPPSLIPPSGHSFHRHHPGRGILGPVGPVVLVLAALACDSEDKGAGAALEAAAPSPTPAPQAPPPAPEVRAPDIVVDPSYVAIGNDKVPTLGATEATLVDRIGVFLNGKPMIEGQSVDVVAMRNARPSQVSAAIGALRRAKATAAAIKTEARDNSTQRLPLTFTMPTQSCTTVAWIAKDAAIDVWPASGGRAKRIIKGLAGPDMTLGTDAVRTAGQQCDAPSLVVGADEAMTWGLVFDLATASLTAPGSRASAAVLVTSAVPGRKLSFDEK